MKCFFSPVQGSEAQACLVDTDTFGSVSNGFNGSGSIPEIGETCFNDTMCDLSNIPGYVASGYYIVDEFAPSAASPKNWVRIGANGVVINKGTC